MGINCGNLVLLKSYVETRGAGASLGKLVMYGRLHNTLSTGEKVQLARRYSISQASLAQPFAEDLLRAIGADAVTSIDVSDYEKCDIVLDLMEDIAQRPDLARLCESFDTVLDFGTSEHVFNYPQALVNAWNLLREGGRYIFDLPVNGWINHGLVQFTPSYFHSIARSPYFSLDHLFFHGKHGRIVDLAEFDSAIARKFHLRGKMCAWGVMTKRWPAEHSGALRLNQLRVMQVELHGAKPVGDGRNRSYSFDTVAAGFRRQLQANAS